MSVRARARACVCVCLCVCLVMVVGGTSDELVVLIKGCSAKRLAKRVQCEHHHAVLVFWS